MRRPVLLFLALFPFIAGCTSETSQCPSAIKSRIPGIIQAESIAEAFPELVMTRTMQNLMAAAEQEPDSEKEIRQKADNSANKKIVLDEQIAKRLPPIRHSNLIYDIYEEDSSFPKRVFFKDESLTPAGTALMQALNELDRHALDVSSYKKEMLDEALALIAQSPSKSTAFIPLNAYEIQALADYIESSETLKPLADQACAKASPMTCKRTESWQTFATTLLEEICDKEKTPIPRAAGICETEFEKTQLHQALEQGIEYALADAWFSWSEDMKFGNTEKFSPEELQAYTTEENPNDIHPKYYARIVESRLKTAFSTFVLSETTEDALSIMSSIEPQHEQYAKLQQLREKYRGIVAAGGWNVVPPDKMFAGGSAPLVRDLKKRLQTEGYYDGELDDHFDKSLTSAIQSYQKHHQLEETGEVSDVFWRSLNVPATQRLAEIEVNIRRWHKTVFEPRSTYIYVNIPSFTVELWHEGSLKSSHRAVVGSSTKICNTRTHEWELMNSTRLMHARMTYLVFNPYWNVPPRIEVDEFLPRMAADPKWLENSDFEYYTPKGGGRVLRQKPGENNSLGRVKLIFPNRYNIYIHDTPSQNMFNYPVRAFSHGCMRVEGAMKFAQEVLEIDGQWDKKKIHRFFVEKGEHPLDLITPIDVFIDYHTVTVDENGNGYFLADVYKKIRDEISPPTAAQRRCDPRVDKTSQFRSGADTGP